jgi:hypothetical protein
MSFTAPRTWVYGETVTEAQFNEQFRDNLNAIWVGTNAGDMDYYTSNAAKSRIGIGNVGDVLSVNSSTVPTWIGGGMSLLAGTVLAGSLVPGGSINFTNLNQSFTHLHCMVMVATGGTNTALGVYLNGDTAANYAYRVEYIQDDWAITTTNVGLSANELFYGQPKTSFYSSYPASLEFDLFNYSGSALWKVVEARNTFIQGNSDSLYAFKMIHSFWRNTDPVTSIQFCISPLFSVGTILPGSSFQIYGLK